MVKSSSTQKLHDRKAICPVQEAVDATLEQGNKLNNGTNKNNTCVTAKGICVCAHKTTQRSETVRRQLIHRLNRIEGQIRGIRNMVEHDAYCPDILIQCAAVNAALNAFNRDLVAQHIRNCVTRDIKNGDDQVVDELVKTLQKLMK